MKIKLINQPDKDLKATEQVLINRGIKLSDAYHYLNTTDEDINSPLAFGKEKMSAAARLLMQAVAAEKRILVVVDCDCDGYTSSAILITYLHDVFPSYTENYVDWFLHSGKQHGLSDLKLEDHEEYGLIIAPDAASNDYDLHLEFAYKNIPVLVLDHHEAEFDSPNAIVINNQLSDYPNKHFAGAGVTWQFCRYLDNKLGVQYADKFIDLASVAIIGDVMDITNLENRYIISNGLQHFNNTPLPNTILVVVMFFQLLFYPLILLFLVFLLVLF